MHTYSLKHLADATLLSNLLTLVVKDRQNTAAMLAHLAEVQTRKLYAAAGYPSLHEYCVVKLGFSESAAYRRTQAAHAAQRFPVLFEAVADGRLNLAAVCLLSPKLTPENVLDLVALTARQRKSEIERRLAERFPRTEFLPMVQPIAGASQVWDSGFVPGQIDSPELEIGLMPALTSGGGFVLGQNSASALQPQARITAYAADRYRLELTMGSATHDLLREAQALLSHALPSGDPVQVIHRSLALLVRQLKQRKFGTTSAPRQPRKRASRLARFIPAEVRRAISRRDGEQCTFVSADGHRCAARTFLEFDHVQPVRQGGTSTIPNLRLRCRTHNQFEADRSYGADFMNQKREQARRACEQTAGTSAVKEALASIATSDVPGDAVADAINRDVLAGLRELGVGGERAQRAVAYAATVPGTTLEGRMRAALRYIRPRAVHIAASDSQGQTAATAP